MSRKPAKGTANRGSLPAEESSSCANPAVQSVSAFFPCYNDAKTIRKLCEAVKAALDGAVAEHEIIVVNDGSTDSSAEVLERLRSELGIRVITHKRNRGYGGALRSGMKAATYQWVFYTDGDGQYDAAEITALIGAASPDVDWVQGYKLGRKDNLARKIIGKAYSATMRFIFRIPVSDVDCDFRLMRKTLLERVALVYNSGVICVEMMAKFARLGARYTEVGINHYPREHGRSQFFTPRRLLATFRDLAKLRVQLASRSAGKKVGGPASLPR